MKNIFEDKKKQQQNEWKKFFQLVFNVLIKFTANKTSV